MADGVLGPKKEAAVQLVEEEDRGAQGLATIRRLRAVVQPVLEALPKTPTATPSVVVSYHDLVTKEPANNILSSHTILESDKTV